MNKDVRPVRRVTGGDLIEECILMYGAGTVGCFCLHADPGYSAVGTMSKTVIYRCIAGPYVDDALGTCVLASSNRCLDAEYILDANLPFLQLDEEPQVREDSWIVLEKIGHFQFVQDT